jgi:hypothetical protein
MSWFKSRPKTLAQQVREATLQAAREASAVRASELARRFAEAQAELDAEKRYRLLAALDSELNWRDCYWRDG